MDEYMSTSFLVVVTLFSIFIGVVATMAVQEARNKAHSK